MPKSLDKIGNKIPRNTVSSNNGARIVVVKNKRKKEKKLLLFKTISSSGLLPFWLLISVFIINESNKTKGITTNHPFKPWEKEALIDNSFK